MSHLKLGLTFNALVFAVYSSGHLLRYLPSRAIPLPVQACAHLAETCFLSDCYDGVLPLLPLRLRIGRVVRNVALTFGSSG